MPALATASATAFGSISAMGVINLFLIRHGESVDNVAGLLAGVRDSPLTSHGVIQARRLASRLAATRFDWIFASTLKRAVVTAETIRDAQSSEPKPSLVQVSDLREKDFGSDEGRRWGTGEAGAEDAENKLSMRERAARFIDMHMSPIVLSSADGEETINIAVVSHGMILATLLTTLRSSECFWPSRISPFNGDAVLRWSNTGYTRLELVSVNGPEATQSAQNPRWPQHRMVVSSVNNVEHLAGLKKTRGGIGSAQFDTRQRTVTSFFASGGPSKKRKAEEKLEK